MKHKFTIASIFIITALIVSGLFAFHPVQDARILSITVPATSVRLFWKDGHGKILGSLQRLKAYNEDQHRILVFAMNGGMYQADQSPQGLYIEQSKILAKINTAQNKFGNFYLSPNGIFYITVNHKAAICSTQDFQNNGNIKFATQSGPLLVIDGSIHPKFKKGSDNLNVRNGVGILPNGMVLLAMSKKEISLYDFAGYFKDMGCKNALYLDGYVSRAYYPAKKWLQLDGNFGVMIGVLKDK